jgi:hypothetical protein
MVLLPFQQLAFLDFAFGGDFAPAFFGWAGVDTAEDTEGLAGDALAGTAGVSADGCPDFLGLLRDCSMARALTSSRSSTTSCCKRSQRNEKSLSYG